MPSGEKEDKSTDHQKEHKTKISIEVQKGFFCGKPSVVPNFTLNLRMSPQIDLNT